MTGLKDDETCIGKLYEDCKSFIKINSFFSEFSAHAVKFVQDRVIAAVEFMDESHLREQTIDPNR